MAGTLVLTVVGLTNIEKYAHEVDETLIGDDK